MKLLLEIGTEELPPGQVVPSLNHLARGVAERATAERLTIGQVETFATPRRLAIRVSDVAESTPQLEETRMGPSAKIAFDADGNPTRAAIGFARGQGIDVTRLTKIVTPKGEYVGAHVVHKGRPAGEVLAPILGDLIGSIAWPKPMRWGWEPTPFARPIHWIVALLDDQILPLTFAGVTSGNATMGHRFLENRSMTIATPGDYERVMKAAKVVPGIETRRRQIETMCAEAVAPLKVVADDDLLDEVVQLVERPIVGVGTFDPEFLELPREVLISEMKEHQRYFAVEDADGGLSNRFVVVYNTPVKDPNVVIQGNQRVLAARLSDGRFFLTRDRQRTLASRVDDLEQIIFLKQLGTMRAKVDRVVMLSAYLSAMVFPTVARFARRAALLSKADLTSEMVGEFPELQGVMGREYATKDGEPAEVAAAIEEHYQPKGAADSVPGSKTGVVVSIADKMDTLAGCFAVNLVPTGTADPYGLRRAALGIIRTILKHDLVFSLEGLWRTAVSGIGSASVEPPPEVVDALEAFFKARLKSYLSDRAPSDVIDAVVSTGIDDLPATVAKIDALAAMRDNADFEPLAAAFKRVANILKKGVPKVAVDEALLGEDAERTLWAAYRETKQQVEDAVAGRDFAGAASSLIELKGPVDRFFDDVLVMADDEAVRTNRLALLDGLRQLFEQVGDVSRIQVSA